LDQEVVEEYFKLLKKTFQKNGLTNSPCCLYNCDETFLPLDATRENGVTLKEAKYVYARACGT